MARLPVASLLPADSPRRHGIDQEHVRLLAESGDELPPVLVHRATLRVVDGMHRLHAAVLRGHDSIDVEFFDGAESEIFLQAVRANVVHGLPLSLQDRKSAAVRLLQTHAELSDRALARVAGLSPKTVGAIRRCSGEENPHPNKRIGRDGRAHPMDTARRRQVAAEVIAERPEASLREVAALAGIAVSTAHEARRRLQEESAGSVTEAATATTQPRSSGERPGGKRVAAAVNSSGPPRAAKETIKAMLADPSLRLTQSGRELLRLLLTRAVEIGELDGFMEAVPAHSARRMADVAAEFARTWDKFGRDLRMRAKELEQ
ncbi:hypothetical protein AOB60_07195 [Streptomyces noursei]|uniref:ParB-like N-terminal domain-containing protein n=2 Tax=Streptomyces TaxID=1883 RepID=A0A2N8PPU7_STRNR|nr:hypothetical protein AOB60_07195 [Streptomyces noursei]